VRERSNDILHQISRLLTAKADVIKFETLNIKGVMGNPNLALSVADAAMSRLLTLCAYKADWRGRRSGWSRCRSLSRELRHMVITMKVNNSESRRASPP
jgi:hypothetical protein